MSLPMVAALFVERGGVYWDLPGVDPWDATRDARNYSGPYPVVAHPPCDRWCQMARYGHKVGEDEGCFDAAISAVRRWGGVLEHPASSLAWKAFALAKPQARGWTRAVDGYEGWVCQIFQRNYGHRARKATWLYWNARYDSPPPVQLIWGPGLAPEAWISADRPRSELAARGIGQLSKKEARATPVAFRDLLLSIARSAHQGPAKGPADTGKGTP